MIAALPIWKHSILEEGLLNFGERIKTLRDLRGWTQDELAERSGLSKPYLSRLESGKRERSDGAIKKLAAAFSLPESLLIHPTAPPDRLNEIAEILEHISKLSPEQIDAVGHLIQTMLDK